MTYLKKFCLIDVFLNVFLIVFRKIMKQLQIIALAFMLTISGLSLNAQSSEYPISIGFAGAKTAYNGEVGNSFFDFNEELQLSWAARLGLYLSPSLDISVDYSDGRYGLLVQETGRDFLTDMNQFHVGVHYKLANGKIMNADSRLRPYIALGAGVADFNAVDGRANSNSSIHIPVGIGAKLYLTDQLNLWWNSKYGIYFDDGIDLDQVEDGDDRYLQHSLGLAYDWASGADTDGDGIRDANDACPDVAGLKEFGGCPDSDKDGIKDGDDACPLIPGTAANNGCPDSDGDGIADKDDKCPNVAGLASMMGCPDSDNDGITDAQDECPNEVGTKETNGCPDTDGDGVANSRDKCPDVAGLASLSGCPDTDGDGIADGQDDCPTVAGVRSANGCPDGDGDGVADADDKCPEQSGPASNNGCPLDPDSDNDGVVDRLDRCPRTPGLKSNNGCPEVKEEVKEVLRQALEGIYFETNSATIKTVSYPVLDNVVTVMNDNPSYKILIGGHTDSRGQDEANRALSQRRADAVKTYLANKGVSRDRMRAVGFGETQPVASNDTAAGRAKNRRVQFTVEFE